MRFLCLHGSGTSSQVRSTAFIPTFSAYYLHDQPTDAFLPTHLTLRQLFQMQTAALRYELGDDHLYEFVQGTVPWPMAPGEYTPPFPPLAPIDQAPIKTSQANESMPISELEGISDPSLPYWSYCSHNVSDYATALDQLNDYIASEGPFDGVLGFSQGALLALLYLVRHRYSNPASGPPFQCAILLSLMGSVNQIQEFPFPIPDHSIETPTAMIWGNQDGMCTSEQVLEKFWARDKVWKFIHTGAHEVPGPNVPDSLKGAVKQMRRAVFQAQNAV